MSEILEPTLWRSCRALANRTRLSLLKAMIDEPPLCVQTLAERCKLKKSVCSQYLRILNARGFLQASRRGRWVDYSLGANPSVKHADDLLKAVVRTLRSCSTAKEYAPILKDLTIFTCPKRILMVRAIHANPDHSPSELSALCHMPYQTLHRQLKKLERRAVISLAESRAPLCNPTRPLAKTLLKLVLEKS
ncbi:MAG: winged helix-turn-helix transcriptional regulator [bacterium]